MTNSTTDFSKLIKEAKAEEHQDFVQDLKADQEKADTAKEQAQVDDFMMEHFATYNIVVAQATKMKDMFEQDPYDIAKSYAIAAGMVIGAMSKNREQALLMCRVVEKIAGVVGNTDIETDEGISLRVGILDTGHVVEGILVQELSDMYSKGTFRNFNPNKGAFKEKLLKRTNKYRNNH